MRNLTEAEMLSLTGLLKLEQDGYIVSKALQTLPDEELKKQGSSLQRRQDKGHTASLLQKTN